MNKIEQLRSELNNFKEEFEKKIGKLEKEAQGWKPQEAEEYWYYDKDTEDIRERMWFNCNEDNIRLCNKVIFKTESKAQRYADYQKAKRDESYEFSKEEWEDGEIDKYYIYYDYEDKELKTDNYFIYKDIGQIYFITQKQAQEFIDKYEKEILEFEFGIKE